MGATSRIGALAYLLLASVYLIYLPHAQFLLDDWGVITRYEQVREVGPVFLSLIQNTFHHQFRFQWLSYSIGYVLFLVFGPSPAAMFLAILLVHVGSAIALQHTVERLGMGSATAFLAGAAFIVIPTVHAPLMWSNNCSFFVWSTFWFLLYWRSLASSLTAQKLDTKAAIVQAVLLLLALFSGDPVFGLLFAAAPLTGLYLRSKATVRATALAAGTVGIAAVAYALFVNRMPLFQQGVGLRYGFSVGNLKANLLGIVETYRRLTGFGPSPFYRLEPSALAILAFVVTLVAVGLCRRQRHHKLGRTRAWVLAAGLWAAAYGPVWFVLGHEYRYDYVPSPFLALGLAIPLAASRVLAGAMVGFVTLASLANMRQGWIPQSRNTTILADALRRVAPARGDLVIASGTPLWIGTAPHFAMLTGWASAGFAERVTGVPGVELARDIVGESGRLWVYHQTYKRELNPEELSRTHVFVTENSGRLAERGLLAQETQPGQFRLYALKPYVGPDSGTRPFARDQLSLWRDAIYFAVARPSLTGGSSRLAW